MSKTDQLSMKSPLGAEITLRKLPRADVYEISVNGRAALLARRDLSDLSRMLDCVRDN